MARRVVLGQQADGSFGLRVSSAGHDALTAIDDGTSITFDSRWTDIAKLYIVGLVSWAANSVVLPSITVSGFSTSYPSLGYVPFAEVRRLSGNVVFDDFFNSTFQFGSGTNVEATRLYIPESSTSDKLLFVVYQIPVPSG